MGFITKRYAIIILTAYVLFYQVVLATPKEIDIIIQKISTNKINNINHLEIDDRKFISAYMKQKNIFKTSDDEMERTSNLKAKIRFYKKIAPLFIGENSATVLAYFGTPFSIGTESPDANEGNKESYFFVQYNMHAGDLCQFNFLNGVVYSVSESHSYIP